jgi:hypothetical protein
MGYSEFQIRIFSLPSLIARRVFVSDDRDDIGIPPIFRKMGVEKGASLIRLGLPAATSAEPRGASNQQAYPGKSGA